MNRKWEVNDVGESGCMCGDMIWKGFAFDVHCHRGNCRGCPYGGIHIVKYPRGKLQNALRIAGSVAKYMEKSWRTDVKVVENVRIY